MIEFSPFSRAICRHMNDTFVYIECIDMLCNIYFTYYRHMIYQIILVYCILYTIHIFYIQIPIGSMMVYLPTYGKCR